MRTGALALAAAAALSIAGCGAGGGTSATDFEGEEAEAAQAVEDLSRGAQRREADDICRDLLARELRERITDAGGECGAEVKLALEDADAFDVEVTDVTVTGTRATAEVEGDDGDEGVKRTLELVKEGDAWRIASF